MMIHNKLIWREHQCFLFCSYPILSAIWVQFRIKRTQCSQSDVHSYKKSFYI